MKFAALVSGGKDSLYSILECQRQGHELVACVHLGRPDDETEESFMYQTAASEVIKTLVEECLGVPLILHVRTGLSVNTALVYEATDHDEVEDLCLALQTTLARFPNIQGVSSGAILSTYQRTRVESVCSRLGLTSLSYLWRRAPQRELLARMIDDGIDAVLVKTAAPPGLMPRKHLGKTLAELQSHFHTLHNRFQFHICGEGGEYETLVLDCPFYKKRLVLDATEVIETDDGVGTLQIQACHSETKRDAPGSPSQPRLDPVYNPPSVLPPVSTHEEAPVSVISVYALPMVRRVSGGLWHVSEILSSSAAFDGALTETQLAVQEAKAVFGVLRRLLGHYACTPQDVIMVHMYLSEMAHFTAINEYYRELFGIILPPSRSCVAVGRNVLPGGRRILFDCIVQNGSGDYLRGRPTTNSYSQAAIQNSSSCLREVLHVQSISHWGPVCVGPYSQANTIGGSLHFMAGQIGLVPATMKLNDDWKVQLQQSWRNVAATLDSLQGGSLDNVLSGLVYVATECFRENGSLEYIDRTYREQVKSNSGIVPGSIDNTPLNISDLQGYEDEETMLEDIRHETPERIERCPLLIVSIFEMPVGALTEIEVISATRKAASCLSIRDTSLLLSCQSLGISRGPAMQEAWECGHDFSLTSSLRSSKVEVYAQVRTLGSGATAFAIVTAHVPMGTIHLDMEVSVVFTEMLAGLAGVLRKTNLGSKSFDTVQIRLYFITARSGQMQHVNDGIFLRSALLSAATMRWKDDIPAITVVPVDGIAILNPGPGGTILYAMQTMLLDPTRLQTELWVHHERV